ncbi:MAG TPA: YihY/virulence factor BrkB family protein [Pyrinomonadaceae bacterium]|jgi:membrane protein
MSAEVGEKYHHVKTVLYRLYNVFWEEDILSRSAQVAFYLSFSLFPLLLFLVNLFGLIIGGAADLRLELFSYLRQIMPYSAYILVQKTILEVTESSSGGKLTFGLVIALWSASAGMDSLRIALNHVYKVRETRSWWMTKLESLVFTLLLIFLLLFVLGTVFYGWKFLSVLLKLINFPVESFVVLQIIQWITFIVVLFVTFGVLYRYLPNQKDKRCGWVSPGSLTAIVLWILVTNGFRVYLMYFDNYDKTYGSLGAVIILMLWLYLTALVILIGGSLNSVITELANQNSSIDSPCENDENESRTVSEN